MRMSGLFGRTLRQAPSEAENDSHRLILRAALARQDSAGVYSYLPLGLRVIQKIQRIMGEEMDRIGACEIRMPVVVRADLWKETKRWYDIGPELFRIKDSGDSEYVLSMMLE